MSNTTLVDYQRHVRPIPYRALFRVCGIVVAAVDGALALCSAIFLLSLLVALVVGRLRWTQLPFDACALVPFSAVCSTFIAVGGIRSLTRGRASRTYIRAGLGGHLLLGAVSLVRLFMLLGAVRFSWPAIGLAVLLSARVVYVAAFYLLYSGIRGDLYFARTTGDPSHRTPVISINMPPTPAVHQAAATPADPHRYLVSGFDARTGAPLSFKSKATSENLAHRSAVALGLDPARIDVLPLDACQ